MLGFLAKRATHSTFKKGKVMPILVVDDDAVSRHEIVETLRQEGHEVVAAANGREALVIFLQGKCQLVITTG
jgi:CheY-like chemotaxis protein